jgi:hypothetical protein
MSGLHALGGTALGHAAKAKAAIEAAAHPQASLDSALQLIRQADKEFTFVTHAPEATRGQLAVALDATKLLLGPEPTSVQNLLLGGPKQVTDGRAALAELATHIGAALHVA